MGDSHTLVLMIQIDRYHKKTGQEAAPALCFDSVGTGGPFRGETVIHLLVGYLLP